MTCGIYCYKDTLDNDKVIYVGKDSNIDTNQRHKSHLHPSKYSVQIINRTIQNNPERYDYEVVCESEYYSDVYLNCLEKGLIKVYNPKFNFTIGGGGCSGYNHSEESKKKISDGNKGKILSNETRRKMSESHKGNKNPLYGKTHSDETCKKISKTKNSTGFFRVSKHKNITYKQGFTWVYQYSDGSDKQKAITSVNLDKLKEKVLAKGLEWIDFNEVEL